MMLENFPQDVELTAGTLNYLINPRLIDLIIRLHEKKASPLFTYTPLIRGTIDNVERLIKKTLPTDLPDVRMYRRIPINTDLKKIVKQSKTQHKITFLKGDQHACWSDDCGGFIMIPENYLPAAILHEIGHIENRSTGTQITLNTKLLEKITQSSQSVSTEDRLSCLLTAYIAALSLDKKEEYDADSFKLQKATKKQLTENINLFPSNMFPEIRSFDDYLEFKGTLSFEFFNANFPKILTQQLFNILGTKNTLAYLEFFYKPHPSDDSRMVRIQERIAELEKLEKADEHLAQLKIEAKAMRAAEREFEYAQKSRLQKLFAKIIRCRYLQFLAGTKKAPREQLRARL
jgi:hypothetical protein